MALLCNNTFEFQSLFGRLHCQPTTALHAHTRPGIQMRCRVFSCGIFIYLFIFFFIKQTFSSDAGDNAISSSFVRLGVCSRFVKLSEEMVNCLRETITHSCPAENCPSSTGFNSLSQHFREIILEMYLVQGGKLELLSLSPQRIQTLKVSLHSLLCTFCESRIIHLCGAQRQRGLHAASFSCEQQPHFSDC